MTTTEPRIHRDADGVTVWHGDCIDVLRQLPDASVHAVVTDPPYGIAFMGKAWDQPGEFGSAKRDGSGPNVRRGDADAALEAGTYDLSPTAMRNFQRWVEAWATECLRVLKPGGHLLAFGGSRTWHRLQSGIEDAGFEVRDSIAWLHSQGMPKGANVAAEVDKLDAVTERLARARESQAFLAAHLTAQRIDELTGTNMGHHLTKHPTQPSIPTADMLNLLRPHLPEVPERIEELVAQRTVESQNYAARKVTGQHERAAGPAMWRDRYGDGVLRAQARERRDDPHTAAAREWEGWGTNLKPAFEPIAVARKPLAGTIGANVVLHGTGALNINANRIRVFGESQGWHRDAIDEAVADVEAGRWPPNVVIDEITAAALDEQSGVLTSGMMHAGQERQGKAAGIFGEFAPDQVRSSTYVDSGGASRFFPTFRYHPKAPSSERPRHITDTGAVLHPTVKPLGLMRWLVRLVTPPGGTVLEPFAGSGTTLEAAVLEGFPVIGIEREADYLHLIDQRLGKDHQVTLFGDWEA